MPGCAIDLFESAADYAESLREFQAVITPAQPGPFGTHLIRVELPLTRLLDAREPAGRGGLLFVPDGWSYAFFATRPDQPIVWNGDPLSPGEILLAGDRERLHQRTEGATGFGGIGIEL